MDKRTVEIYLTYKRKKEILDLERKLNTCKSYELKLIKNISRLKKYYNMDFPDDKFVL